MERIKDIALIVAVLALYAGLCVIGRGKPLPGDRDEDNDD